MLLSASHSLRSALLLPLSFLLLLFLPLLFLSLDLLLLGDGPTLRQALGPLLPLPTLRAVVCAVAHRQPPLSVDFLVRVEVLGHAHLAQALRARRDGLCGRDAALACVRDEGGGCRDTSVFEGCGINIRNEAIGFGEVGEQVSGDGGGVVDALCGDQAGDGGAVLIVLFVQALEDCTGCFCVLEVVCIEKSCAGCNHERLRWCLCLGLVRRSPVFCCLGEFGFRCTWPPLLCVQGNERCNQAWCKPHIEI